MAKKSKVTWTSDEMVNVHRLVQVQASEIKELRRRVDRLEGDLYQIKSITMEDLAKALGRL